jgi:uncharacterized repeat protein (TIGR04138 family)
MPPEPKKPIEHIVHELGRYPIDAFAFIQECLSSAAERVHGPMSKEQVVLTQWMARNEIDLDQLGQIARTGQLPPDVAEALEAVGGTAKMNRHVTGQELCWAVRDAALERWGLMARRVLARWQVTRTEDIGRIIFALVESDWLAKQPSDSIDDFAGVFDFPEAFDQHYDIEAK